MSVELPKGRSYNDVEQAYLDTYGIAADAITPDVKAAILKASSEAIRDHQAILMVMSGLTLQELHDNPNWYLQQSQQAA
jgi:hypothetical protein